MRNILAQSKISSAKKLIYSFVNFRELKFHFCNFNESSLIAGMTNSRATVNFEYQTLASVLSACASRPYSRPFSFPYILLIKVQWMWILHRRCYCQQHSHVHRHRNILIHQDKHNSFWWAVLFNWTLAWLIKPFLAIKITSNVNIATSCTHYPTLFYF